jgi:hypothetical protein
MRAHWWWALLERALSDLAVPGLPAAGRAEAVAFAVELVEIAVEDGMPDYLGARWFARIARTGGTIDGRTENVPDVLTPDNVARRVLEAFVLTRPEAVEEAARRRRELLDSDDAWFKPGVLISTMPDADDELVDRLQKVEYLMPELEALVEHIRDPALGAEVRAWLALRDQLEIGEEAANRGHELLAQWQAEQSRGGTDRSSSNGIE